ncbi:MAG: ComF family protein [Desulfuromonadales bacterium]|nr:ComF family protein [Desulfuromonadales bacterium]
MPFQLLRSEFQRCLNLFLPPACLLCGKKLPPGFLATDFCPECRAGLPQPAPARCPICAVAHRTLAPASHHCEACLRQPPPFARVHAVGPYAGTLQEAVQRFKYHGQLPLERPLGILLAESLPSRGKPCPDLIVPVPLHRDRLRERGYNQALQLARQVGRRLSVPVEPNLLRRIRATASQQGLDAVTRKSNLRGAFAVTAPLSGRHLLLVDDVLTTGATARECAGVLRQAGAASVEVAVLGRA